MDILIIPAYQPDERLIDLVNKINRTDFFTIIVNDGSSDDKKKIFASVSNSNTIVLSHDVNQGKGKAIKTALQYIKDKEIDCETIAIMDCDGQHLLKDVKNIIEKAKENKDALVIGARKVGKEMPLKSRLGNQITRSVFKLASGLYISDTQTGLRTFDRKFIDKMLQIKGNRYEYETNMLLDFAKDKIKILEVQIETVYHDKQNSCSHFRVIRDSFMIYKDLLKFGTVSFLSFLLDYILFAILTTVFCCEMILANILARVISGIFNYEINCHFVFKEKQTLRTIIQYFCLAIFILCINNVLLTCYTNLLNIPALYSKILTEITLFIISFLVQKIFIFRKKESKNRNAKERSNLDEKK